MVKDQIKSEWKKNQSPENSSHDLEADAGDPQRQEGLDYWFWSGRTGRLWSPAGCRRHQKAALGRVAVVNRHYSSVSPRRGAYCLKINPFHHRPRKFHFGNFHQLLSWEHMCAAAQRVEDLGGTGGREAPTGYDGPDCPAGFCSSLQMCWLGKLGSWV